MCYKGVCYTLKKFNATELKDKQVHLIASSQYDYYLCYENNTIYYI